MRKLRPGFLEDWPTMDLSNQDCLGIRLVYFSDISTLESKFALAQFITDSLHRYLQQGGITPDELLLVAYSETAVEWQTRRNIAKNARSLQRISCGSWSYRCLPTGENVKNQHWIDMIDGCSTEISDDLRSLSDQPADHVYVVGLSKVPQS